MMSMYGITELYPQNHVPSWIDKIIMAAYIIESAYKVGKVAFLFVCSPRNIFGIYRTKPCIILKYSYSGNIQYHKISRQEIDGYIECLSVAKLKIDEIK